MSDIYFTPVSDRAIVSIHYSFGDDEGNTTREIAFKDDIETNRANLEYSLFALTAFIDLFEPDRTSFKHEKRLTEFTDRIKSEYPYVNTDEIHSTWDYLSVEDPFANGLLANIAEFSVVLIENEKVSSYVKKYSNKLNRVEAWEPGEKVPNPRHAQAITVLGMF